MAFDAEEVTDRICHLAHYYIAKHLPPPMWPLATGDSLVPSVPSKLNDAVTVTRTGLKVTGGLFKYAFSKVKVHYYQNETQKIDEILKTLQNLNNPDACENWITFMIQLGEEAHLPVWRAGFQEFLHAIRCIILENIQADKESVKQLSAKSEFLQTYLRIAMDKLDGHYETDSISPEVILPLETEIHHYMRKLAWIGHRSLIRGTGLIHQVFPDKTYRYFDQKNADKRQLPHSIYPIVLAAGEMSFYCYYAKKLGLPPNHNHKVTYHMMEENWECLTVLKNSHPPGYGDNLDIQKRLNFFSDPSDDEDDDAKEDGFASKKSIVHQ